MPTTTHPATAPNPKTRTLRSAPLGPGSLTWKYFGDRRLMLLVARTGTLQNMHPAVGAALQEHSNFFDNPWDRIARSIPEIVGVVYDPDADDTGAKVRDFHRDIKGTDSTGSRYHAMDPDVYWWTHATFIEAAVAINEFFGTPLTHSEKDQLIAEGVTWWRRYGLSDRPVLDDWDSFDAYWQQMLTGTLESNATTDYALAARTTTVPPPPGVPAWLWRPISRPVMSVNVWLLAGLMPEQARQTLGITWNPSDQRRLEIAAALIRHTWPLLPARARYFPRARTGMRATSPTN
jgi:uncharacterized protein (DUF2236 family)